MLTDIAVASSFWGISDTAWSALTAIGTLALAGATVATIIVGNRQRRADRQDFERRLLDERRERQDEDARQVSVTTFQPVAGSVACLVNVSAPVGYQVSQLTVNFATDQGALIAVTDLPVREESDGRMWWRYDTDRNSDDETPMISFTDRQNALYFQYRGVTRRFAAGTAFSDALPVLRDWLRGEPGGGQTPGAARARWLNRLEPEQWARRAGRATPRPEVAATTGGNLRVNWPAGPVFPEKVRACPVFRVGSILRRPLDTQV